MILPDSAIWIDHLRRQDERLIALLVEGKVLMHAMVLGELACGSLHNRPRRLQEWRDLPALPSISDNDAMDFMHRHALMSKGIGFIDLHLLAATAAIPGTRLWTRDQRLAGIAGRLGLAFSAHEA